MTTRFEEMLAYFEAHPVPFRADADEDVVYFTVAGDTGHFPMKVRLHNDMLILLTWLPYKVPEGARENVTLALNLANYGLRMGSFELDPHDGELRFRATSFLTGEFDESILDRSIGVSLAMLEVYSPAILSVIYANDDPTAAVRRVERQTAPSDTEELGDPETPF